MARKKSVSFINVAVFAAIRNLLTYSIPDPLEILPGQRVRVPLGTRRATGLVIEPATHASPGFKVREILSVLDPEPILSPELLTLGLWMAEYYVAPVGEVFRAMLPLRPEIRRVRLLTITEAGRKRLSTLEASLFEEVRGGEEAKLLHYVAEQSGASGGATLDAIRRRFTSPLVSQAVAEGWAAVSDQERNRGVRKVFTVRPAGPLPAKQPRLSPVARRILEVLQQAGEVADHRELLKAARGNLPHLKKLSAAGLLRLGEARPSMDVETQGKAPDIELTPSQTSVLTELSALLDSRQFSSVLLHGVTASGKTEIYLRLIARCLERGRTALMLVPEISLTPSVQSEFLARFGSQVAVLHSGLTETERHESWWRARRGDAKVVLGTRSAVFAPLENLGVVIVDEEHDSSYKQEETPRYHGRDSAVVRGRLAQALVVLGSATPSMESFWNAREGKYRLFKLEERIPGRSLAPVEIVDMRQEFRETHTQVPISRRLKQEIDAQFQTGAQTMLLLNRRGYSWFLLCRSCGETHRCVNCSISLTYHRRGQKLICHYCGYTAPVPSHCATCGSEYLHYVGEGTEKLEAKIAEFFPTARVARLDRDVAQHAGRYGKILGDFRARKIDILVGTQLISKGHDFPGVTLVGVVSADQGLGMPDFRAAERTFQLLTQVAGRAGRGEAPGRVLVQTFYPDHYAIRLAADQNYEGFYSKELRFRRMMHYPPCAALANVVAQGPKLDQAAKVAGLIGHFLTRMEQRTKGLKVLGPSAAPLARIEGRFRIQFLLKGTSRAALNEILRRLVDHCEDKGIPPQSVMIDMDPVSVM
ncbi:MAG: primosomal protein N' [Terriglobia bacterium]